MRGEYVLSVVRLGLNQNHLINDHHHEKRLNYC